MTVSMEQRGRLVTVVNLSSTTDLGNAASKTNLMNAKVAEKSSEI